MKNIFLSRVGASDIRKEGRRRSKRETLLRRDAKQTFAPKALAERLKSNGMMNGSICDLSSYYSGTIVLPMGLNRIQNTSNPSVLPDRLWPSACLHWLAQIPLP